MDFLKSLAIAAAGMRAQSGRMRVIAENVAFDALYALCDDGTVWIRNVGEWKTAEWSILPPIPQRSAP